MNDVAARECTCPDYVIQCAHIPDGEIVILGDWQASAHGFHLGGATDRYIVSSVSEYLPFRCRCGEATYRWRGTAIPFLRFGTDLLAAREAFHEAEERLLRGDD